MAKSLICCGIMAHAHIYCRQVKSHATYFYAAEKLWEKIHRSKREECEQFIWNHAMKDLGLKWNVTTDTNDLCRVQTAWRSHGPLAVIVFPQEIFCRKCCKRENTSHYYLLHLNAAHGMVSLKRQVLERMNSWFLRHHWHKIKPSGKGTSWLKSVYSS